MRLNNNIELSGFAASISSELLQWRGRRAAVSSFGFSGTNGHARQARHAFRIERKNKRP